MLNFAEQTGSGAVIVVWSFLKLHDESKYTIPVYFTFLPLCGTEPRVYDYYMKSMHMADLVTLLYSSTVPSPFLPEVELWTTLNKASRHTRRLAAPLWNRTEHAPNLDSSVHQATTVHLPRPRFPHPLAPPVTSLECPLPVVTTEQIAVVVVRLMNVCIPSFERNGSLSGGPYGQGLPLGGGMLNGRW